MSQKRVTFEVAKALKEAGYPQPMLGFGYATKHQVIEFCNFNEGEIIDLDAFTPNLGDYVYCPTYIDTWLWLWRKKKIAIGCPYENTYNYWFTNINAENDKSLILWKYSSRENEDPEEAIAKAIDYIVKNNTFVEK